MCIQAGCHAVHISETFSLPGPKQANHHIVPEPKPSSGNSLPEEDGVDNLSMKASHGPNSPPSSSRAALSSSSFISYEEKKRQAPHHPTLQAGSHGLIAKIIISGGNIYTSSNSCSRRRRTCGGPDSSSLCASWKLHQRVCLWSEHDHCPSPQQDPRSRRLVSMRSRPQVRRPFFRHAQRPAEPQRPKEPTDKAKPPHRSGYRRSVPPRRRHTTALEGFRMTPNPGIIQELPQAGASRQASQGSPHCSRRGPPSCHAARAKNLRCPAMQKHPSPHFI
jgi:hypothetical protein